LRDVFMNFVLAGRDTTASLLTWTFYMLYQHPDVREKVVQEILSVVKGEVPTAQELELLKYTKQVLQETLRLYPSVPVDARVAVEDTKLPNGYTIKKGVQQL